MQKDIIACTNGCFNKVDDTSTQCKYKQGSKAQTVIFYEFQQCNDTFWITFKTNQQTKCCPKWAKEYTMLLSDDLSKWINYKCLCIKSISVINEGGKEYLEKNLKFRYSVSYL